MESFELITGHPTDLRYQSHVYATREGDELKLMPVWGTVELAYDEDSFFDYEANQKPKVARYYHRLDPEDKAHVLIRPGKFELHVSAGLVYDWEWTGEQLIDTRTGTVLLGEGAEETVSPNLV